MERREQVLRRIVKTENCWLWNGPHTEKGYGVTGFTGFPQKAHRAVYELLVADIPDGMQLDHLCQNKGCVNPSHLEPVTNAENMRRSNAYGGHARRSKKYLQRKLDVDGVPLCLNGHRVVGENARPGRAKTRNYMICVTCRRLQQKRWRDRRKVSG